MLRDEDDLLKVAMVGDMELATSGVTTCWVAQLAECLSRYDFKLFEHGLHGVDVNAIMHLAQQEWWQDRTKDINKISQDIIGPNAVRSVPDSVHDGFKGFTYARWFADDVHDARYRFWQWLYDKNQIQIVAQFRLGSHHLQIEQGRTARPYVLRSMRKCSCSLGMCEDEIHFMFECTKYDDIRLAFADIMGKHALVGSPDDDHMRHSMNVSGQHVDNPGQFWRRMAGLISTCMAVRSGDHLPNEAV